MREPTLSVDAEAGAGADAGGLPPPAPRWRRWAGHAIGLVLFGVIAWLLAQRARSIDWSEVGQALQAYPLTTLAGVLALGAAAHLVFGSYELLARRYVGHHVPAPRAWAVGVVSFAFNLNFGSLIGGLGLRWRLYSRLGLDAGQIGRVLAFNLVTNWIGFIALAGLLLLAGAFEPPPQLRLDGAAARVAGAALLAVPLVYVGWCAVGRPRAIAWRGRRLPLPPARLALAQIALSSLHWLLTGAIIQLLLPEGLPFLLLLGTLMTAAVAGALVHVPGGLGVLEGVFLATLAGRMPDEPLVAALLAYRAAFYLLPLAGATALYLVLERQQRRR